MLLGAGAVELARQRHSCATARGKPAGERGSKRAGDDTDDDPGANSTGDVDWVLSVCGNDIQRGQHDQEQVCGCSRNASDTAGECLTDSSAASNPAIQHTSNDLNAPTVDGASVCKGSGNAADMTVAGREKMKAESTAAARNQTQRLRNRTVAAGTLLARQCEQNDESFNQSATNQTDRFCEGRDALIFGDTGSESVSDDDDETNTGPLIHFRASLFATESHGRTPLVVAAGHGQAQVAALLLRYGPGGELAVGVQDAIALDGTPAVDDALCSCECDYFGVERRETGRRGHTKTPSVHQLNKWLPRHGKQQQDATVVDSFEQAQHFV